MPIELWVRLKNHVPRSIDEKLMVVLVPIQPRHILHIGVASQAELSGPGVYDLKMVLPEPVEDEWSDDDALQFCIEDLEKLKQRGSDEPNLAVSQLFLDKLEELESVDLGVGCIAPNKQISQELVLETELLQELLCNADSDISSYQLLKEIGLQCIVCGNLDNQSTCFRDWFGKVVAGKSEPPSRRPKRWSNIQRDANVCALVQELAKHGFTPYRNDVQVRNSASDIVAEACLRVRVRGISSYETVRKIYQRIQSASVGTIAS